MSCESPQFVECLFESYCGLVRSLQWICCLCPCLGHDARSGSVAIPYLVSCGSRVRRSVGWRRRVNEAISTSSDYLHCGNSMSRDERLLEVPAYILISFPGADAARLAPATHSSTQQAFRCMPLLVRTTAHRDKTPEPFARDGTDARHVLPTTWSWTEG